VSQYEYSERYGWTQRGRAGDNRPVTGMPGYDIRIGRGLLAQLPGALGTAVRKVLVVHPPTLAARAEKLRQELSDHYQVLLAEVPDAEAGKRVEVAAFCWQVLGQTDFTRTDAIIGFGGGAVTDLAGFVAATWLRGVRVVQVPTTVLGMVDAAVGGKSGINTAEGKNLVGVFHAPAAVLCDLDLLHTLPRTEILAGFAEIVKAGFIRYPEILDTIEASMDVATDPNSPQFRRVVELSIQMKADVVGEDFTEQGPREILNYGHTLGHAVEHAERYRCPVGRWESLLGTMQRDKKARAGQLRFIVLDDLAKPTVMQAPDGSLLFAAYQEIGA